jgi:hypothetical protein
VTFVGYSIKQGPREHEDYASYAAEDNLQGQVALMLRFEPIDEQGHSLWATGSAPWSNRATLSSKVREAAQRGASAILIEAGLDPTLFDDTDNLMPLSGLGRLLTLCVARTGCEEFGLLVGQRPQLIDQGMGQRERGGAVREARPASAENCPDPP